MINSKSINTEGQVYSEIAPDDTYKTDEFEIHEESCEEEEEDEEDQNNEGLYKEKVR